MNQLHEDISWASCICDSCLQHIPEKIQHNFFPRRYQTNPIPDPYEDEELEYWDIVDRDPNGLWAEMRLHKNCPRGCVTDEIAWQDCAHLECKIHLRYKLAD